MRLCLSPCNPTCPSGLTSSAFKTLPPPPVSNDGAESYQSSPQAISLVPCGKEEQAGREGLALRALTGVGRTGVFRQRISVATCDPRKHSVCRNVEMHFLSGFYRSFMFISGLTFLLTITEIFRI